MSNIAVLMHSPGVGTGSRYSRDPFPTWVPGGFSVAFDPLDGSSIVDTNFTVGTIFGVWPGDKLTGITGRDQVASAMGIYGPRTTYVVAIAGYPGTHEFLLLDDGEMEDLSSDPLAFARCEDMFAPYLVLDREVAARQGNYNYRRRQALLSR